MPITDDQVVVADMDTEANINAWTQQAHPSLSHNNVDSQVPIYREGGGCAEGQIDPTDGRWRLNVSLNLTGGVRNNTRCFVMWVFQTAPAAVSGMTNMQVGFSDSTNMGAPGGLWDFKQAFVDGDTYGWYPCLIYPTNPSEPIGSFGSVNLATLSSIGVDINNSNGIQIRLFGIEQSFTISQVIGRNGTVTLDDFVTHSMDKGDGNDIGVVSKKGEAYTFKVVLTLGHISSTSAVTFNQDSKVIHFDNFNVDHDIGFTFVNHATHANNFTLTNSFVFWNTNTNSRVFENPDNCDTWVVTGNTFLRGGLVDIPNNQAGFETKNNVFNNCLEEQ